MERDPDRIGGMAGLRERKKQRTRQDLARTALRLFATQGFEATTVDDIVEPIQVSRSTFFRYFPTKEHALFPDHDERLAQFREQLAESLQDSPPLEAVRAAALDAADAVIESFRRDPEAYRTRQRLISSTPSLQALALQLDLDWEAVLADALERRLPGRGPARQLRARLLAGSFMGTVGAFHRAWEGTGLRHDPGRYRDEVMAVIERGLAGILQPDERPSPGRSRSTGG
jgi:AcrR family transcriptional regulator